MANYSFVTEDDLVAWSDGLGLCQRDILDFLARESESIQQSCSSHEEEQEAGSSSPPPSRLAQVFLLHDCISQFCRGVELILDHHGLPQKLQRELRQKITEHFESIPSGDGQEKEFLASAKHLLVYPMARFAKADLPAEPAYPFRWTGQLRRWVRTRFSYSRKNLHLWWSFFQAKRACAPVSDEYVNQAYKDHAQQMVGADPVDPQTLEKAMSLLGPTLEKVGRELRPRLRDIGDQVPHAASNSASFEKTRSRGGQAAALRQFYFGKDLPGQRPKELVKMRFYPRAWVNGRIAFNVVVSEFDWQESVDFLQKIKQSAQSMNAPTILSAKIQGICEPLKVRVISKGPAKPYYLAKHLQVELHTILRKMPQFSLIGQPLNPFDLHDIKDNTILNEQLAWFSGDYKGATDGLSASLSRSILSKILREADVLPQDMDLYLSVLAPHHIVYPEESGVDRLTQQNGQLMGSILSFPILCLANYALYLLSIEGETCYPRPHRCVKVNGDDILYLASREVYDRHFEFGKKLGLQMSVGKTYYNQNFAVVNSVAYDFPVNTSTARCVPYLNAGLFFGSHKVQRSVSDDDDEIQAFSVNATELLEGSLPGKGASLLKRYISIHSDKLKSTLRGRNLFIHPSFGGLGVLPPDGFKWKISARQKAVAVDRYQRLGAGAVPSGPRIGPLSGPRTPVPIEIPSAPWHDDLDPPEARFEWPTVFDGKNWTRYPRASSVPSRHLLVNGLRI